MDTAVTLGRRIRSVRRHFGLRQEEFGTKIGISGNRVSEIENNKGGTSASVLEELCRGFPVSHEWLLTGKGSMLKTENTRNDITERLNILESAIGRIINAQESTEDGKPLSASLFTVAQCRQECLQWPRKRLRAILIFPSHGQVEGRMPMH